MRLPWMIRSVAPSSGVTIFPSTHHDDRPPGAVHPSMPTMSSAWMVRALMSARVGMLYRGDPYHLISFAPGRASHEMTSPCPYRRVASLGAPRMVARSSVPGIYPTSAAPVDPAASSDP